MNLLIEKWGNSLSLRLPADYVHRMGFKEGDQVEASPARARQRGCRSVRGTRVLGQLQRRAFFK